MPPAQQGSLKLNDLEVRLLKVRDTIDHLKAERRNESKQVREKIDELEKEERELERMHLAEKGLVEDSVQSPAELGTALRAAVSADNLDTVKQLCGGRTVKRFIDLGNFEGTTALIKAAMFDQLAILEVLVGAGATLSKADNLGRTPLMLAAANGSDAVVRRLLELRAPCEPTDASKGWNAFFFAAQGGHVATCRLLLEACGAALCLDTRAKDGKSAADLTHLCADRSRGAAVHAYIVQAAQARGEDTSFVSKWSRVRRLSMATSVIGAFDRVTRSESRRDRGYGQPDDARSDAKDDGGFSFAKLLLRASGSLAPTGWLRSLARPWAWGPPPPVEARL